MNKKIVLFAALCSGIIWAFVHYGRSFKSDAEFEKDATNSLAVAEKHLVTTSLEKKTKLERLAKGPVGVPTEREITSLNSEDVDILNTMYKEAPLANRRRLVWALCLTGNDISVGLLTNALVAEFNGKNLNQQETDALYDTVQVLGFLAAKNDAAFGFLKDGTNYDFWKKNRKWTGTSDHYGGTERILVSNSILGIGYSGRAEAAAFLNDLAKRDAVYVYNMAGSIATAVFYHETSSSSGIPKLLSMHLSLDEAGEKYREWTETTENGQKWRAWSSYVKGHKPEEAK